MLNAVVIPFPKPASGAVTLQSLAMRGPAQVIIFPGVRYGRIPETETEDLFAIATAPLKTSPSRRK